MAQHLLVSCVFARDVWLHILSKVSLQQLSPNRNDKSFEEWCKSAEKRVSEAMKKGFNSLVALGAWWIWKHRNNCV
jgi:hypothetical protein